MTEEQQQPISLQQHSIQRSMEQLAESSDVLQVYSRLVAALPELPDSEELEELLELTEAISQESERYISAISSTCKICGYEETIEIPEAAPADEIIRAMQTLKGPCIECAGRAQQAQDATVLAEYVDGLPDLEEP